LYLETRANPTNHNDFLQQHAPWGANAALATSKPIANVLPPAALAFYHALQQAEHPSNKPYFTAHHFLHAGALHETGANVLFSDHYYTSLSNAVLQALLTSQEACNSPELHAFATAVQPYLVTDHPLFFGISTMLHCDLAIAELNRYVMLSAPPTLRIGVRLIQALRLPVNEHALATCFCDVVAPLLEIGQAALLLPYLPYLTALDNSRYIALAACLLPIDASAYQQLPPPFSSKLNAVQQHYLDTLQAISRHEHQAIPLLLAFMQLKMDVKLQNRWLDTLLAAFERVHYPLQQDHVVQSVAELGSAVLSKDHLRKLALLFINANLRLPVNLFGLLQQEWIPSLVGTEQLLWQHALTVLQLSSPFSDPAQTMVNTLNTLWNRQGIATVCLNTVRASHFLARLTVPSLPHVTDEGCCVVMIAAFNAQATLQYAYNSIAAQNYSNVHIVIVDDASTVPVSQYLQVNAHVPTTIVRHETNKGPYACRNTALKQVQHFAYFVVHDADDWAHPEKLGLQIAELNARGGKAVYSRHIRVSADGRLRPENVGCFEGHGPMTSLFCAQVLHDIGPFDEVLTRGDMEYKARIAAYYGKEAIIEHDALLVLALDWHSNSKQHTDTEYKKYCMQRYKAEYAKRHALLCFMRPAIPSKTP